MALRACLVLVCLAALGAGLAAGVQQACTGCLYRRPDFAPQLELEHHRLARPNTASAHAPEQLHLAFAGPGAYAISWVTYPQEDPDLVAATEAAATTLGQAGAAASALVNRKLAAAAGAQQLRLGLEPLGEAADAADSAGRGAGAAAEGSSAEAEAAAAGLGAAANKKKKKRKHRRPTCHTVRSSGVRSIVQYGFESGVYAHSVDSLAPVGCYSTGSYLSGALHRVIIGAGYEGPLPPNTTVYYRVGDPARGWSMEASFRTAPTVGSQSLPYRLGLIGDLGQTEHSVSTMDHLEFSNPGSIILVGDLSYADGYQPRWDTWQRLVSPHTSRRVWMYCVGNHEIEITNGVKDFLAYTSRFHSPYQHSGSPSPLYYSYEVAGAHVIMLGSYAPYGRRSEQYAWLVADLEAVDRTRTPWVIVAMHAPWYNSNYAHQGEGEAMRVDMEELMYGYGVDLVFAGHVHAYERHHRVFDNQRDECAPIHINIGDGGNREGPDKKYYKQPNYSAFREPSFGHGTLDLIDDTHAEWRWHRNQDDAADTADSVSIVRNPDCKPRTAAELAARRQRMAAETAAAAAAKSASQQGQQQQQQRRWQ